MATDGPTPAPCDREVFENGTLVMMTHSIPSNAMEGWVRKVAEQSGQCVDWHFAGGRACIKALGDLGKVRTAISDLMPEHDKLQRASVGQIWADLKMAPPPFEPSCALYGEGEWNSMVEMTRQIVAGRGEEGQEAE